jgi:hypothetical protein
MVSCTLFVAFFAVLCLVSNVAGLDGDTFTVNCAPLTIQRSDPIVTPGIASTHVHNVIGGNAFRRSMNGKFDAFNATATTCDKSIDHSNYWVPALYHQRSDKMWELVTWSHAAVYYQKRACDYSPSARNCDKSFLPLAFPDGFRMVAGDPARRTQDNNDFAQKAVSMMCLGTNQEKGGFPTTHCDAIRAQVYFPSCWDGINVDTADHHSHVAYPAIGDYNGGVCPASHPKALLSIFYEFFFETQTMPDFNKFAFANGDATGFGYHGDFIMGWTNRTLLQNAHRDCIDAANCPTLGNKPQTSEKLIYPAIYEEEIGLNGPIPKLPGNNPVTFSEDIINKPGTISISKE